jgi:hypothetical protein
VAVPTASGPAVPAESIGVFGHPGSGLDRIGVGESASAEVRDLRG